MARKYCWKTGCDVEATLSVIGGRWKPVLVCHLLDGRKRFGELCRLTPNATQRMVTLQLRDLEADGVLTRHVYAEVPPRVEYELTEFGRTLEDILVRMQEWGGGFKARMLADEDALVES
ncbi:MAG: helix-turn-helix domain-containing protein [Gemmatimonadota bacterium]